MYRENTGKFIIDFNEIWRRSQSGASRSRQKFHCYRVVTAKSAFCGGRNHGRNRNIDYSTVGCDEIPYAAEQGNLVALTGCIGSPTENDIPAHNNGCSDRRGRQHRSWETTRPWHPAVKSRLRLLVCPTCTVSGKGCWPFNALVRSLLQNRFAANLPVALQPCSRPPNTDSCVNIPCKSAQYASLTEAGSQVARVIPTPKTVPPRRAV